MRQTVGRERVGHKRWLAFLGVTFASVTAFALLVVPGIAYATTLTVSGSMEGNLPVSPGDTLLAGYDFTIPGGPPTTDTVTVGGGTVSITVNCPNGSTEPLTIALPTQSYTVPAGDGGDWFPSGDQSSSLVYQGSITVPSSSCGGVQGHAPQGATFSANFTATDTTRLNVRFHYEDLQAKNGQLGSSWSGTASVTPGPQCSNSGGCADNLTTNLNPYNPYATSNSVTVDQNTSVSDEAVLTGTNASQATGSVTFTVYSDSACTHAVSSGGTVPVVDTSSGAFAFSDPVRIGGAGTYYWQASYQGDANNAAALSPCSSEVETVSPASPPYCVVSSINVGTTTDTFYITVQDAQYGLESPGGIVVDSYSGFTSVTVPAFNSGDNQPLIVTAAGVPRGSPFSLTLTVTNTQGTSVTCDPIASGL